jgi:hypothetical protein
MTKRTTGAAQAVAPAPRKRIAKLDSADDIGHMLPLLARAAADKVRAAKPPISRSEALAAAPWDAKTMPPAWERTFREAYADRLEELGVAAPAAKSGTKSTTSGKTDLVRLVVYVSPKEEEQHRATAKADGVSLSTWARRKLAT